MNAAEHRKLLRKVLPVSHWTHHPDGRITLGRVLDSPEPLTWLPAPKPCTRCKQPSWSGTPRGRAEHPCCGGALDRLTDQAFDDVVWNLIRVFPGAVISEERW